MSTRIVLRLEQLDARKIRIVSSILSEHRDQVGLRNGQVKVAAIITSALDDGTPL